MRAVAPIVAVLIAVVLVLLARRGTRRADQGRPFPTGRALVLAVVLTFWFPVLGFTVGYAVKGTALSGGIGAGVGAVLLMMLTPLLRWLAYRHRTRYRKGVHASA